jgi:hypothetical protein
LKSALIEDFKLFVQIHIDAQNFINKFLLKRFFWTNFHFFYQPCANLNVIQKTIALFLFASISHFIMMQIIINCTFSSLSLFHLYSKPLSPTIVIVTNSSYLLCTTWKCLIVYQWALSIVKHETNVIMNLNICRSWSIRDWRILMSILQEWEGSYIYK